MTDTDIEDEMLQLSNEFEKAMEKHEQKEIEPDEQETETEIADSALVALQKKYEYIVAANERNQRRIKHLMYLLDETGRKAARLGLRFDEMEKLAD